MSNIIQLTIPDEYHILQTGIFKNECPYDGTPLSKTGTHHGCYDGEFGIADTFTCEKNCIIQYVDMWKHKLERFDVAEESSAERLKRKIEAQS